MKAVHSASLELQGLAFGLFRGCPFVLVVTVWRVWRLNWLELPLCVGGGLFVDYIRRRTE